MSKVEEQLIWLLHTLWEDGRVLFYVGMPLVVDELGRLLYSNKQARKLLSALSHRGGCWESGLVDREDKLKQKFAERTESWSQILDALRVTLPESINSTDAVNIGEPTGRKFTYPIEKRRTRENVDALRRAESHLDVFWAAIDQALVAKVGRCTAQRCGTSPSRASYRALKSGLSQKSPNQPYK
ncbi:hypothetical protein BBP40_012447 [Aspergillus hancockii]|nr:hypothetical protein BBP40_012447 [Aspergillus hancockii]